ncbi:hypothetical protein OS190_07190 [Sulfitobacter sp. F26204]|uniref:hypothetical protein n=1 Tax=Sulfitobacter sp. F26204 TaxID=2996014 RepID=UPI00225E17E2|nr:hypothetical protein [Sulfitobacter sp. F26204]MCX7559351.1 hypothetical protein [Sulfitobacter sp. F26204]
MNGMIGTIVGLFAFWMAACCFCGFKKRFVAFLAVGFTGLAANMAWMVFGLKADPLEDNLLIAQTAAAIYALSAFGIGLFLARVRRLWSESRITSKD